MNNIFLEKQIKEFIPIEIKLSFNNEIYHPNYFKISNIVKEKDYQIFTPQKLDWYPDVSSFFLYYEIYNEDIVTFIETEIQKIKIFQSQIKGEQYTDDFVKILMTNTNHVKQFYKEYVTRFNQKFETQIVKYNKNLKENMGENDYKKEENKNVDLLFSYGMCMFYFLLKMNSNLKSTDIVYILKHLEFPQVYNSFKFKFKNQNGGNIFSKLFKKYCS